MFVTAVAAAVVVVVVFGCSAAMLQKVDSLNWIISSIPRYPKSSKSPSPCPISAEQPVAESPSFDQL